MEKYYEIIGNFEHRVEMWRNTVENRRLDCDYIVNALTNLINEIVKEKEIFELTYLNKENMHLGDTETKNNMRNSFIKLIDECGNLKTDALNKCNAR